MPLNRNQTTATAGSAVVNGISLSQSLGGAGKLLLNGSLSAASPSPHTDSPAGASAGPNVATLTPAQNVVIASAGNDSGINWTISGTDTGGSAISEVLAGANASGATSALLYASVTSIAGSGATASTVTAGTGVTVFSPWLVVGPQREHYEWLARTFLAPGGSATYEVQVTSDPKLMIQTGGYADDIKAVLSAQTADSYSANNVPWTGIRLKVTAGGPVTLRWIPSRTA